jgi:hypothetical protein
MAGAIEDPRGLSNPATQNKGTGPTAGNPGTFLGNEKIGGSNYARYRAEPGTWVSASLKQLGYDQLYGKDAGYGAYAGVPRATDASPLKTPDRIQPGQEYLIPVRPDSQAPHITPSVPGPAAAASYIQAVQQPFGDRATGPGSAPLGVPGVTKNPGTLAFVAPAGGVAELLATGGGAVAADASTPVWLWTIPAAAVAWASYEWYGVYRAHQSLAQAKANSADLKRQLDQAVRTAWQNGAITDDEYFLYLASGVLVIQPRDSGGGAASPKPAAAKAATVPQSSRVAYRTTDGEVLGKVPSPSSSIATAVVGREREAWLGPVLSKRFPGSKFRVNFRVGPDVEWIGGLDPGFDIADLKPEPRPPQYGSYGKFVRQVRGWSDQGWAKREAPATFRAAMISYTPDGYFCTETILVVGPNYLTPLKKLDRPPKLKK